MALSIHDVTIKENTFHIRRFQPFLALEILGDLQKTMAGPFISALDGRASQSEAESGAAMMAAFGKLSASIDGKGLRLLAERLLNPEYVSVTIGDATQARKLDAAAIGLSLETAADILQLCWEVVQHNYAEVIARLANPTILASSLQGGQPANFVTN